MIMEMLEPMFDRHYQEHQGIPSCYPFHKYCECGSLNKVRALLGPYNSISGERSILLQYRCSKYHPLWNRKHTHFTSKPWHVSDLLNMVGKEITPDVYKKLAEGKWTFVLSGGSIKERA